IHPPMIFLGFAILGLPFAYAVAALITRNYNRWTALARGPVLFGVSILGCGISLGGLWAYETQGWGGFWAWDPVENVSLVPWLFLVVLAHGIIVQTAQKKWHTANLLMAGLPFISFVYGTFLTRSGLLDKVSVHSFASMERVPLEILRWFLIVTGVFFTVLLAVRRPKVGLAESPSMPASSGSSESRTIDGSPYPRETLQPANAIKPSDDSIATAAAQGVNRTSFYQLGTLSLSLMAAVIAVGMSWPVITTKILKPGTEGSAVEPGIYHQAVIWFFTATMLAMAIAPFVGWKREKLSAIIGRFVTIGSAAIGLTGAFLILAKNPTYGVGMVAGTKVAGPFPRTELSLEIVVAFLLFLCSFVLLANLWRVIELAGRSKMGIGSFIAHVGMAIFLGGLIISKSLEREEKAFVRDGSPGVALGYTIAFKDYDPERYYDRNNFVKFSVTNPAGKSHDITPTLYYYEQGDGEAAQVWPYIERTLSHDMYFFMAQPVVDVWETPMNLKPGETKDQNGIKVTYVEMTRVGEAGAMGTVFGAKLKIEADGKTYEAHPTLTMNGPGNLEPSLPQVGEDYRIAMAGMNAADKSATLQLYLSPPLYQIQLFYKPMTCLVWIGTGIFTLGGLMSAVYRRVKSKSPERVDVQKTATI
ncbi:MAG TPA: cytochrome c biogenesis protein CcsA, partial [Fimbriimonas sp.]|nr:cytochrome c biogenesis protein CcsA [Fimbriimonas sp.]